MKGRSALIHLLNSKTPTAVKQAYTDFLRVNMEDRSALIYLLNSNACSILIQNIDKFSQI